jgi:hypothetical protein
VGLGPRALSQKARVVIVHCGMAVPLQSRVKPDVISQWKAGRNPNPLLQICITWRLKDLRAAHVVAYDVTNIVNHN